MRELINFTLNAPQGANSHTVVFKQPLLIKPNSNINVNSVVINWTPLTGYKDDTFAILTDLPIKTFHAKGFEGQNGGAAENRLLIFDGNLPHTGHSPSKNKFRILINMNLL